MGHILKCWLWELSKFMTEEVLFVIPPLWNPDREALVGIIGVLSHNRLFFPSLEPRQRGLGLQWIGEKSPASHPNGRSVGECGQFQWIGENPPASKAVSARGEGCLILLL